ncbi:MAG: OmpH family outer membrane protein [Saprospiraceae bacterium]
MKNFLPLFLLFNFIVGSLGAQKYGHVNYRALIDSLDGAKVINDQLNKYEKSLSDVGESMIQKFQTNYSNYQESVKKGNLTGIQQKEIQSDLETEQNAIGKYQQSARESLDKRNAELLRPFLSKMDTILKDFAKREGYLMIFDSSMGVLLGPESENLFTKLVAILNKK